MRRYLVCLFLIFISKISAAQSSKNTTFILETVNNLNQPPGNNRCDDFMDSRAKAEIMDWTDAGFKNPEIHSINLARDNAQRSRFTHEFRLSAVMFRNTGWSPEVLRSSLLRVAEIYSQCGIKLADAKLIVVDAPNDWLDIDHNRYAQIAQMIPQSAARPILAFVRADGRHGDTGYAYRRGRFGQAATVDTGWITNEVNSDTYKKIRTSGYSPLAHELAHILGNSGHVIGDEKNLLGNSPVTVNNHITKEQCETFKRHPSITPL